MRKLLKFYHFLGSVHFAISLIACTALLVSVGTFLEAYSGSHLYSANFTYEHPVFFGLLWGFFINILISALRRWPFKFKHIPFLITHLGLLMLLGGVILKSYYGTQGTMQLLEGGASNRIIIPNTYAIHLEKKDSGQMGGRLQIDYPLNQLIHQKMKVDQVEFRLVDYAPHSQEHKQTWFKDDRVIISGLEPISVENFENASLSSIHRIHFHDKASTPWKIFAFSTPDLAEVSKQVYLQGVTVQISDTKSGKLLRQIPLQEALALPLQIDKDELKFFLNWNFSLLNGFEKPCLAVAINDEKMEMALAGTDSLINKNISSSYRGKLPFTIDLVREPTLLFIQDHQEDDYLFFFNEYGEIHSTLFKNDQLPSVVVYDEGFGGYAVQTPFFFDESAKNRHHKEQTELTRLATQLRKSLEKNPELSPPLQLIKNSLNLENVDFVDVIFNFLQAWENSHQLLYDDSSDSSFTISDLKWNSIPLNEQYACGWLCSLLEDLEIQMQKGKSFLQALKDRNWPFVEQFSMLNEDDTELMMTFFAQQLWAAASQLPPPMIMPEKISMKALSAYFRAYGITLNNIRQPIESTTSQALILETPLTLSQKKLPSLIKWEDNQPLITLEITEGSRKEYVTLTYDKYGIGLPWPILNGKYLLRFQPLFVEIPYKIRLHNARQINYPGTQQPYSYESDIIVTDLKNQTRIEKTISMNNVHETKEGYRFYLSSLSPSEETAPKRVQIVVNHDPAKYILTYPGALVLSLGIILLFWMRPYKA